VRFRITQQRGGIRQRARDAIRCGEIVEQGERAGDAARLVGIGEMRHQGDAAHGAMAAQLLQRVRRLLRRETQAVHAAVDLEPDIQRTLAGTGIQQGKLPRAVDHAGQVVLRDEGHILGVENPLQQQDHLIEARLAQMHRILNVQQRKTVRRRQCFGHPGQAVPVAVRLDHRHDARGRRGTARHPEVVLQRAQVDMGLYGAWHEFTYRKDFNRRE
jgi:hypothetical protein